MTRRPFRRHNRFRLRRAPVDRPAAWTSPLPSGTASQLFSIPCLQVEARCSVRRRSTIWVVVWVAGGALIVDAVTAALTFKISRESLNIRAAFVHNVSDALASVAVIVAGSLTILFGWSWTDVVATLLISAYVLFHGVSMMRGVVRILMESVPHDLSIEEVASALASLEGVAGVHHVHVWQFDEELRAMEAHLVVPGGASDFVPIKQAARTLLRDQFRISHTTLELELPSEEGACVRGC